MKRLARACYRLCLLAYPEDFRRQFESSMVATFDELVRSRGTITVLPREVLDVLVQGLREREAHGRRSRPSKTASTVELWLKDLRYAARTLARSRSFAFVVVVSLALGIGANTAIFSIVNAMLLKPMPVKAPEELVAIYAMRPTNRFPSNFSYQNYLDIREEKKIFSDLVGFYGSPVSLHASREPELVWSELVTENYFEGLGVSAASGRLFESADVEAPVVVLSYEFWRRRFLGGVDVVGRVVRLNGNAFTVIGVAAPGFTGAKMLGFNPDLWVPLAWHRQIHPGDDGLLERRHGGWLNVRGRMAPGVTLAEAQAALGTIAARLEAAYPEANKDWQLHVYKSPRKTEPFLEVMTGGAIPCRGGCASCDRRDRASRRLRERRQPAARALDGARERNGAPNLAGRVEATDPPPALARKPAAVYRGGLIGPMARRPALEPRPANEPRARLLGGFRRDDGY
jgi:hypothetical protein